MIPTPSSSLAGKSTVPSRLLLGTRFEHLFLACLFLAMLALRTLHCFNYQFDSDEAQHLHIVWGWANGLLQYRDIFDNHAPLFHLVCTPLFKLFPERPDILVVMRLFMVPLWVFCLWCVFQMGSTLYGRRLGLWAALLAGLNPRFFSTATEFRADDLWIAAWFLTLAVLVSGTLTPKRFFGVGFLFGVTFAVSLKTVMLLISLILAGLVVLAFRWRAGSKPRPLQLIRGAFLMVAGMAVVPACLILMYYSQGALKDLYYGTVEHNIVPGLKRSSQLTENVLMCLPILLLLIPIAAWIFKSVPDLGRGARRALLFMVPGFYFVLLYGLWPDVTRESMLPFSPLAVLAGACGLFFLANWLARRPVAIPAYTLFALVAIIEFLWLATTEKPWLNRTNGYIRVVAAALDLTKKGDYLMDGCAGCIYRPRPFYYALETVTRARMRRQLINDDVPEQMIAVRTAVARITGQPKSMRAFAFIKENYLPILPPGDDLRVIGKMLACGEDPAVFTFDVAAPGEYVLLSASDYPPAQHVGKNSVPNPKLPGRVRPMAEGVLDGMPLTRPRDLAPGRHEFRRGAGTGRVALFWAQAYAKGYSPFAFQDDN